MQRDSTITSAQEAESYRRALNALVTCTEEHRACVQSSGATSALASVSLKAVEGAEAKAREVLNRKAPANV